MSLADHFCADEVAHVFAYRNDALSFLRTLPDQWVTTIITDPPYGLGDAKPDVVAAAITAWAGGDRERVPDGRGFMGRRWDAFVPPPAVWDECLRVLKPGGHLAVFAGSRTVDLMGLSIRLAGFDMRDGISAWLYGNGMPKARTVLKGAHEPILLARRPFRGSEAACRAANGTGGLLIEGCRVATNESTRRTNRAELGYGGGNLAEVYETGSDAGRWPTNVVLAHAPLLDPVTGEVVGDACADGCVPGCHVRALDEQSGDRPTGALRPYRERNRERYSGIWRGERDVHKAADSGGASRFFPTFRYESVCALSGMLSGCQHNASSAADSFPPNASRNDSAGRPASADTPPSDAARSAPSTLSATDAARSSGATPGTAAGTAPTSAAQLDDALNAQRVRSAARLCGSCATAIARSAVATRHGHDPVSHLGLGSMPESDVSTLTRSLAFVAADLESSDTTPTTTSLTTSCGYVVHVISESITKVRSSPRNASGPPQFRYQSKAGKRERPQAWGAHPDCACEPSRPLDPETGALPPWHRAGTVCATCERPATFRGHSTVKPRDLMRWLVRLLTPTDEQVPGQPGTVLDPFAGSGTTLEAARLESVRAVGIEQESHSCRLIARRLDVPEPRRDPAAGPLLRQHENGDLWATTSRTRDTAGATTAGSSSTSRSGSDTTDDGSPTGTTSITSTSTSSTTLPRTSCSSTRSRTSASTPAASSATASGGSPADSASSSSPSGPSTGTSPEKAGRSTGDVAPATSPVSSPTSANGSAAHGARRRDSTATEVLIGKAQAAESVDALRVLARRAVRDELWTDDVRAAFTARRLEIEGVAA